MQADSPSRRLSRLRADAASSLRSFLRQTTLQVAVHEQTAEPDGRMSSGRPAPTPGVDLANAKPMSETILLDDERRLRALAKEIKRLITEDTRRGLGV